MPVSRSTHLRLCPNSCLNFKGDHRRKRRRKGRLTHTYRPKFTESLDYYLSFEEYSARKFITSKFVIVELIRAFHNGIICAISAISARIAISAYLRPNGILRLYLTDNVETKDIFSVKGESKGAVRAANVWSIATIRNFCQVLLGGPCKKHYLFHFAMSLMMKKSWWLKQKINVAILICSVKLTYNLFRLYCNVYSIRSNEPLRELLLRVRLLLYESSVNILWDDELIYKIWGHSVIIIQLIKVFEGASLRMSTNFMQTLNYSHQAISNLSTFLWMRLRFF